MKKGELVNPLWKNFFKKGSYFGLTVYIFFFAVFVMGAIYLNQYAKLTGYVSVSPNNFGNIEEGTDYLFNITINNTGLNQEANITQVNITLPNSFIFKENSNGTNTFFETFENTSIILSWSNFTDYLINGSTNNSYFWFRANVSSPGIYNITMITLNGTGDYSTNITINVTADIPSPPCVQNLQEKITSCASNERQTIYYIDTKNCNEPIPQEYENETQYCDGNLNNVIGDFDSFTDSGISLQVYVDNIPGNDSKNFTGTKKIEFMDGNLTWIEFNWNFAKKLNMDEIYIQKQASYSTKGYLLIRNLNVIKTVLIDKLNSSSNSVCVKDSDVISTNSLSINCNASDETIVSCPGTNNNLTCNIVDNKYKVSGISNSLIMEFTDPNSNCTASWNCISWSTCLNKTQSRICTDANNCTSTQGKPLETQTCQNETQEETTCTSKWECDQWQPSECPEEKTQTRTCTDSNNCDTQTGKPNESKTCTPTKKISWLFVFLVFIIIIGIVGTIVLLLKVKKKMDGGQLNQASGFAPPKTPGTNQIQRQVRPFSRNNQFGY